MPLTPRLSLEDRIEQGARAIDRLYQDARGVDGLDGLYLRQALKYHPQRVVFQARLGGRTVILKRLTLPDAPALTRAIAAESDRVVPKFVGDPRLGIAACLGHWPSLGLLAFQRLPGTGLGDRLVGMRRRHRHHLIAQSGEWLARYVDSSCRVAAFQGDWLLHRCAERDLAASAPADRTLMAALLDWLRIRADRLGGRPVTRALCHGDLLPANMIIDRGKLSGIDYGPGVDLPVALEMARFLRWARLSCDADAAQDRMGSATGDTAALLSRSSHLLLPGEEDEMLPFFSGFMVFQRMADVPGREKHLIGLRRAARSLIDNF